MTDVVIRNPAAVEDALVWGPAMQKLSPLRQRFVIALLNDPSNNGTRAAIEAGYTGNRDSAKEIASRLRHDKAVLEAIHECALAGLHSLKLSATQTVAEVMNNPTAAPRDRLRAAGMVLDRTGIPAVTEQNVTVEHKQDRAQQIEAIVKLAKELGQDPRKLLGNYGVTIDAEFTEVLTPIPGLEDCDGVT